MCISAKAPGLLCPFSGAWQDPSKDQEWLEIFGPPVSPELKTRRWWKPELAMPTNMFCPEMIRMILDVGISISEFQTRL